MALRSLKTTHHKEETPSECPRCHHKLVVIDGHLTKWLNCTNCKFKKLVPKEGRAEVRVTPLNTEEDSNS